MNNTTVDVTHKPKRLQRDNLIQAGTAISVPQEDSEQGQPMSCIPLHNVTIERAIQYYEANAVGEYATLYTSTAEWLRQLIAVGKTATIRALQELKAQESEVRADEVMQDKQS